MRQYLWAAAVGVMQRTLPSRGGVPAASRGGSSAARRRAASRSKGARATRGLLQRSAAAARRGSPRSNGTEQPERNRSRAAYARID